MKKMIVLLILIFPLNLLFSETIRVGFYEFEPYVISQGRNKVPGGAVGEYWQNHLIPGMRVSVEWQGPLPILRLLKNFAKGDLDVILIFPRDDELPANPLYPDNPTMTGRPGLTLPVDNPLTKISGPGDIAGFRISYVKGSFLLPFIKNSGVTIDYTTKPDFIKVSIDKVINKRVDAVLNLDYIPGLFEINRSGYGSRTKTLILPVKPVPFFTVFAGTQQGRRFLGLYNPVNNRLYENNTFSVIVKKYIPESYLK